MTAGLVGSRLGKYEVLEEIGQGGMSVVYRATDTQLKRDVAIKVMHAFLAEQDEARERFHREAVAVARLRHPHIIEIFDYSGEDADTSYIVTELVRGSALAEVLRKETVAPPEAGLLIAQPIAEALAHAHDHGVIHRDLKPENILVGDDGSLKLTDFGIARMLDSHTLTMTGTLLGSPAYMAPEYVEGYATDERADIFSFGAMLYQFATGNLPFQAPTPHALLKRIATGDFMPVEQANPNVHCALARIIEKCLQRLPENRYATARELIADLDAQLERVGLDAARDLPLFLADRAGFAEQLDRDLLPRYLSLGKAQLAAGSTGAAIEDFNRVLALDPGNKEVRRILDRLARRAHARRVVRDLGIVVLGTALLTVVGGTAIDAIGMELARRATEEALAARPLDPPVEPLPLPSDQNVTFVLKGTGDLFIDGELTLEKVTGYQAALLDPGKHEIEFRGAKKTDPYQLVVVADEKINPIELDVYVPEPAAPDPVLSTRDVEFSAAAVGWADVYVDDELAKKNAMGVFSLTLPYGRHVLKYSKPQFQVATHQIEVGDQPVQRQVIRLRPLPAWLFVDGAPDEAKVEVAGKTSPVNDYFRSQGMEVPLGRGPEEHEVVVRHRTTDQIYLREKVRFKPGEEHRLEVRQ